MGEVKPVHLPDQSFCQVHFTFLPERRDRLSGAAVESDESPTGIDEDADVAAIGPDRDSAMAEAASPRERPPVVRAGVVTPLLRARFRVERRHLGERGRDVESVADENRRTLKLAGRERPSGESRRRRGNGLLPRLPRPRELQPRYVLAVDFRQPGVLRCAEVSVVGRPLLGRGKGHYRNEYRRTYHAGILGNHRIPSNA